MDKKRIDVGIVTAAELASVLKSKNKSDTCSCICLCVCRSTHQPTKQSSVLVAEKLR